MANKSGNEAVFLKALRFFPASYHSNSVPFTPVVRGEYNTPIQSRCTKEPTVMLTPVLQLEKRENNDLMSLKIFMSFIPCTVDNKFTTTKEIHNIQP